MFTQDGYRLIRRFDGETLIVEPWGESAFRVRAQQMGAWEDRDFALSEPRQAMASVEEKIEGGQWIEVPAPLDEMPVFIRIGGQ